MGHSVLQGEFDTPSFRKGAVTGGRLKWFVTDVHATCSLQISLFVERIEFSVPHLILVFRGNGVLTHNIKISGRMMEFHWMRLIPISRVQGCAIYF